MEGAFACPECGYELKLIDRAPGRQIQCDWCEAWVEIPFIPRNPAPARRGGRKRAPIWIFWAWAGVALLAVVILVAAASRVVQSRSRAVRVEAVNEIIDGAADFERSGQLEQASAALEAAIALACGSEADSPGRLGRLLRRRDDLARREIKARLETVVRDEPGRGVGECLTLLARARKLPGLADMEDAIREQLAACSRRSVAQDLAAARQAFDGGEPGDSFRLCERLDRTAENLDPAARRAAQDEAKALVARIVEKHGVVIDPVLGQFTFGSTPGYATLNPLLADGLAPHGYLPCPPSSPWHRVWNERAPFHLAIEVIEQYGDVYLNSRNRVTFIEARVVLSDKRETLWRQVVNARTHVPVRKLAALQASKLASGSYSNPEFERLLYDDAREMLAELLTKNLRSIPDREAREPRPK